MTKTLTDLFDLKVDNLKTNLTDYEIFTDKILLDQIRSEVIGKIIDSRLVDQKELQTFINNEIDKTLEAHNLTDLERYYIFNLIDNEINGYGPLEALLEDPNITEIMINGKNEIYIEVDGIITKDESVSFINDEHILRTIDRIISPLGKTIDATNPMVDARLKDGSRINAIIPPLSINGPVLTIRKFKRDINTIEDILSKGTLTPDMARFLEACVMAKCNILITGGTATGKTSLLNVLSSFINDQERVITIEDAAELKLNKKHVISLETRHDNAELKGEVSVRDLLINSLRMRPDRIIIGEVRGKEAFDLLHAMNTGHEGSLTTMHANSPKDGLNRLETLTLTAGMDLPIRVIREYIESAIDIVIHLDRLADGKKRITSIEEVIGLADDGILLEEIFKFNITGLSDNKKSVLGEFVRYDYTPKVYQKIKLLGINLDDIFKPK